MRTGCVNWSWCGCLLGIIPALSMPGVAWCQTDLWSCPILPPEHETVTEGRSGGKVIFATTHPGSDRNLYFHDVSWLGKEPLAVFFSNRTGRDELFGYWEPTGHLVRFIGDGQPSVSGVTCSRRASQFYGIRDGGICVFSVVVAAEPTLRAQVRVHRIADLPANAGLCSSLSENADGRLLSLGYRDAGDPGFCHLAVVEIDSGKVKPVARLDFPVSHIQFSWSRPDLIMFARTYPQGDRMPASQPAHQPHHRMWHVDLSGRSPWPIYAQQPGELVTHECWWTEDRITFCGGHHLPDESHVKVHDMKTQRISIIGAGSWWPDATQEQITRRSWWHAAGSPDGRWVVADNFHGDIVLFDANSTQERLLTVDHRKLRQPEHPHPGWAPTSDRVILTSTRRGNPDLVIAHVPRAWRDQ